jgi:hypothetical protein
MAESEGVHHRECSQEIRQGSADLGSVVGHGIHRLLHTIKVPYYDREVVRLGYK